MLMQLKDLSMLFFKQELAFKKTIFLRILMYYLIIYIFFQIFLSVNSSPEQYLYIFITQALIASYVPVCYEIYHELQSDLFLIRSMQPISFILQKVLFSIVSFMVRFVIIISSLIIFIFFVLEPGLLNLINFKILFFSSLFGACIYVLISINIGLISFFLQDVKILFFLNLTASFCLGGLIVPLNQYPDYIVSLSQFTPYPSIIGYPAYCGVYKSSMQIISTQIFWLGLMYCTTIILYQYIRKELAEKG